MTVSEQCLLLGLDEDEVLLAWMQRTRAGDDVSLPKDVLEGIGCVLSIYASLVILLNHDRSKGWVRAPIELRYFRVSARCP